MTIFFLAAVAVYGLMVGSFLNVVIHRVPEKRSLVRPRSACPACGVPIAARDNIPIVSWLLLRGQCRACSSRIPTRYPFVELLTAGAFLAVALRFGLTWTLPAEIVFVAGLVALSFIDFDRLLLPRVIVYPLGALVGTGLVVAAIVQGSWHRLEVAIVCAVVEFVFLFAVHSLSPRSLGFGDVRFGAVIALALGWLGWRYAFLGFIGANMIGAAVGLGLMAAKKAGRKTPIPFGVFLSVGAMAAMLGGSAIH